MKSTLILYPLLGVILGAAGAGVTITLIANQDSAPSGEGSELSVGPAALTESDLLIQIESLREENQALRDRLTSLEMQPAPALRTPVEGWVSMADFESFKQEVLAQLGPQSAFADEPDEMKAQVADAINTIREEEALESIRRKQENQQSQLEDHLARLSSELGLDNRQLDQMRSALTLKIDRDAELTRQWKQGADSEVLGETKRSNAVEHQAAIESILTPAQLDAYRTRGRSGK